MAKYTIEQYKKIVKRKRTSDFPTPYEIAYKSFIKLGYDKKDTEYFINNASSIVESLRNECWKVFLDVEKSFTVNMWKELIDSDIFNNMDAEQAISNFAEEYTGHIYALNLSNTQSRRSRAGKEFESIIELLLMGANVPMDSQGNIGKTLFIRKGLGKLVDAVSPGVIEYVENKRNTVLISAKTSLRERWQEVPEEMGRTGAREMFLATLDTSISKEVFDALYEANIQVTTTKTIKDKYYKNNHRVWSFEDLIKACFDNAQNWIDYDYNCEQLSQIITSLKKQLKKHESRDFTRSRIQSRINMYSEKMQRMLSKNKKDE